MFFQNYFGTSKLSNKFKRKFDDKRTNRERRRITCFSSWILPLSASSVNMQPLKPAEMQSFQNDVYPSRSLSPSNKT